MAAFLPFFGPLARGQNRRLRARLVSGLLHWATARHGIETLLARAKNTINKSCHSAAVQKDAVVHLQRILSDFSHMLQNASDQFMGVIFALKRSSLHAVKKS